MWSSSQSSAIEFVVLAGCRSGEARHARWSEIDADTWHIDANRTKTGKPHAVPVEPAGPGGARSRPYARRRRPGVPRPPHRQAAE